MTQTDPRSFTILDKQQYANLFTFRKSGEAVKTPVWFALQGGKAYVMTVANAGKVKRIRNNGHVQLGASDRAGKPLGPIVEGQARVLNAEEAKAANALLNAKYGLTKRLFDIVMGLRRTKRDFIEIVPA